MYKVILGLRLSIKKIKERYQILELSDVNRWIWDRLFFLSAYEKNLEYGKYISILMMEV